jgi:hypothetical protein
VTFFRRFCQAVRRNAAKLVPDLDFAASALEIRKSTF